MVVAAIIIFIMVVMFKLLLEQILGKLVLVLHCGKYLLSADFVPVCRNDSRVVVKLLYHCNSFRELLLGQLLRAAQHNRLCRFNLIFVEFAEVLHIHLDF